MEKRLLWRSALKIGYGNVSHLLPFVDRHRRFALPPPNFIKYKIPGDREEPCGKLGLRFVPIRRLPDTNGGMVTSVLEAIAVKVSGTDAVLADYAQVLKDIGATSRY